MKARIVLAQIHSQFGDISANAEKHIDWIAQAKQEGAELIIFPELSMTGYCLREAVTDVALTQEHEIFNKIREATAGTSAIVGMVFETDDYLFYNAAVQFCNGSYGGTCKKIFLPTYGMFEEMRYFASGNTVFLGSADFGAFGLLICEDAWHPRLVVELSELNISMLIILANSPVKGISAARGNISKDVNDRINFFYAQTIGLPVVFVNKVGYEHGVCFYGGSAVYMPDGTKAAECSMNKEELLIVDVDLNQSRRARINFPYFRDELSRELKQCK